jgi:hypothetical protein
MEDPELLNGYYLDRITNPDVLILHRSDGSVVAIFSGRGAAKEEIERTAKKVAKRND